MNRPRYQANRPQRDRKPCPTLPDLTSGNLSQLLDNHPRELSDCLEQEVTASQVRRFYGQFTEIYRSCEEIGQLDDGVSTDLLMLKARINYTEQRARTASIRFDRNFARYLTGLIDKVLGDNKDQGVERFKLAKLNFEAFVGYYQGRGAK